MEDSAADEATKRAAQKEANIKLKKDKLEAAKAVEEAEKKKTKLAEAEETLTCANI